MPRLTPRGNKLKMRITYALGFRPVVLLVICLIGAPLGAAHAQTAAGQKLVGNHPVEAATLHSTGAMAAQRPLTMEITLALHDRVGLKRFIDDQQNPDSPLYHRWLTPRGFTARFGPTEQDASEVMQWLNSAGFQVTGASLDERRVRFTGSVGQAQKSFGTPIMAFGGKFYANTADPVIPARLAGVIAAIAGLDNFTRRCRGYRCRGRRAVCAF